MKKSKIIIFSTALAFLLFANISVTLFDGTESEIKFQLNNEQVLADPTDHLHEPPPDGSGSGGGNFVSTTIGNHIESCETCTTSYGSEGLKLTCIYEQGELCTGYHKNCENGWC